MPTASLDHQQPAATAEPPGRTESPKHSRSRRLRQRRYFFLGATGLRGGVPGRADWMPLYWTLVFFSAGLRICGGGGEVESGESEVGRKARREKTELASGVKRNREKSAGMEDEEGGGRGKSHALSLCVQSCQLSKL